MPNQSIGIDVDGYCFWMLLGKPKVKHWTCCYIAQSWLRLGIHCSGLGLGLNNNGLGLGRCWTRYKSGISSCYLCM